jgi:hypothetical protein
MNIWKNSNIEKNHILAINTYNQKLYSCCSLSNQRTLLSPKKDSLFPLTRIQPS